MNFAWLPLTWDAVAVFTTGFLAVAGTVTIGIRQNRVTELQAEILREQSNADRALRLNDLKLKLLDQRADCIRIMKEIESAFHGSEFLSEPDRRKLFDTIHRVELIFDSHTVEGLHKVAWNSIRVPNKYRLAASLHDRGKFDEAEKANEEAFKMMDEIYDSLPKLISSMIAHARITHLDFE